LKRYTLIEKGFIIEENCMAIIITRPVVNIDDQHDLEYAEFLSQRYNTN
jgi:CMP-N-acetylneuraminic acid synthetase